MITKECFQNFWRDNYGDILPIGYILRDQFFTDRWFRIHSLPDSKRYADNDNEMQIILNRQNVLISDLIGNSHEYSLLFSTMSENPKLTNINEIPDIILLDSIRLDVVVPKEFDTECYLFAGIVNKIWEAGSVDNYLKRAANDERIIVFNDYDSYGMLIVDIKRNRIIAPYDGGVDIFLNTRNERDFYKLKYKDWLSFTESGL